MAFPQRCGGRASSVGTPHPRALEAEAAVDITVKYIFVVYNEYPAVRNETTRLESKMAWMHWRDYMK